MHRTEYRRREKDGSLTSVIFEVFDDGQEAFSETGYNELRWYRFEPSSPERQAARELLRRGEATSGTPVIDLRKLEGER